MQIDDPQIIDIIARLRESIKNRQTLHIEGKDVVIGTYVCVVSTNDIRTLLDFIEKEER